MLYEIPEYLEGYYPELKSVFETLHSNPELLYDLPFTSSYVASYLKSLDYEVQENIGGCGVVATLRNPGPCILLRADMDALPITEDNDLHYKSKNHGKMHACGHDAHTAMLLLAAKVIKSLPPVNGTIKFVFQPAEEGGAGAKAMRDDGVLEGVDEVYAVHVASPMRIGDFLYNKTFTSVGCASFTAKVIGRGGHGSAPHNTIDPIPAAAELILALNSVTANRNSNSRFQTTVVETSKANNAIPTVVNLKGCIRGLEESERNYMKKSLLRICKGMEAVHNVKIDVEYHEGYGPVINNEICGKHCLKVIEKICKGVRKEILVNMGEDFSYFSDVLPGAYMLFGCSDDEAPSNHSQKFQVAEESLMIGLAYWVELVKERLGN